MKTISISLFNTRVLLFIFICLIPLVSLGLSLEEAKNYGHSFFLIQAIAIFLYILSYKRWVLFLSPISLSIFYIGISFALGSWAFKKGYVYLERDLNDYLEWNFYNETLFFVLLCITILFLVDRKMYSSYLNLTNFSQNIISIDKLNVVLVISAITAAFFFVFPFNLSLIGGAGSLSYSPLAIFVTIAIYLLAYKRVKFRAVFYVVMLAGLAFISVYNKRDAVFMILPIFLLEVLLNYSVIRVRHFLVLFLASLFLFSLVCLMSIARGYGDFLVENNLDLGSILASLPFLLAYISADDFLTLIFNNIETNYTFFHSVQAIEYIRSGQSDLAFGSTFLKVFFIGIPRDIAPIKPDALIHSYTFLRSPEYRLAGGSWPANIIADAFWNFHFLGFLVIFLFGLLSRKFFTFLILSIRTNNLFNFIWLLFSYSQFLILVRGSGLDQY
ncbi:oligosaccharide repeat unit polymerase, partial [Paracoccaceae bacterium]|nr:oligosaccharide repeat unit polymerase [Paracoccaceae bacterium]